MSFRVGNFSKNFTILPLYEIINTRLDVYFLLKQRSKKHCTGVRSDSDAA